MTKTKISPAVLAATRRAARFLSAPAERPGQRAQHFCELINALESATWQALRVGNDKLAFQLADMRNEADAAFGAEVTGDELAWLVQEIAECDTLLKSPPEPDTAPAPNRPRRFVPKASPGTRAKSRARKRGAVQMTI